MWIFVLNFCLFLVSIAKEKRKKKKENHLMSTKAKPW